MRPGMLLNIPQCQEGPQESPAQTPTAEVKKSSLRAWLKRAWQ